MVMWWSAALAVLVVMLGCGMGSPLEKEKLALKQRKMVDEINSKGTFKARHYKEFEGLTNEELRRKVGAQLTPSKKHKSHPKPETRRNLNTATLADSFDARDQWPECKSGIIANLPPGNCTANWAILVAETIRDRRCISSNGTVQDELSAYDIISCSDAATDGVDGCNGGSLNEAFSWAVDVGVVTGGKYLTKKGCKPYLLPADPTRLRSKVKCYENCIPNYKNKYADDKVRAKDFLVYSLENENVMNEIQQNGPLVSEFKLYGDLLHYTGGTYTHQTGDFIGYAQAKIIGWGVDEKGQSYWRAVVNFGGNDWGESGTFRILRGHNEVQFEAQIEGVVV